MYVYDSSSTELARFKDLPYAYTPVFSPDGKTLIVKSTEGRLAVYNLSELKLVKKFRFSKDTDSRPKPLSELWKNANKKFLDIKSFL